MSGAAPYDFYGLRLASDLALPFGRALSGAPADLSAVWLGQACQPLRPPLPRWRTFHRDAEGWRIRYVSGEGGWGAFDYDRAARRLTLSGTKPFEDFIAPLIGHAAAVLLRDAGRLVLHGAVIARGDSAIALVGGSGAGKSTLAAALLAHGGALLSDDLVAIDPDDAAPGAAAGPRLLSLAPAAAQRLAAPHMPRPASDKHWLTQPPRAATAPPRLAAIYVLAPRDAARTSPQAVPLAPRNAAVDLMRHLYDPMTLPTGPRAALQACASLAGHVPVRRLLRPDRIDALDATAALLMAGEGWA
ncbi:MAG TPA: hypothetical protein VHW60_17280 [Caulobacteraceae bacterium]|nr:hypothetical protein [Caulobacteraceae bacterium]